MEPEPYDFVMRVMQPTNRNAMLSTNRLFTTRTGRFRGLPSLPFVLPALLLVSMLMAAPTLRAGENRVSVALLPGLPGTAEAIAEDAVFWLGVDMQIKEGWHIYWRNPGDSGLPTSIRWEPHPFLKPGEIHWPRPSRFDEDGITTYGYSDRVTLLVPVSIDRRNLPYAGDAHMDTAPSNDENTTAGKAANEDNASLALTANLNWLVCKDICIPESARVSLTVTESGRFEGFSGIGVRQIEHSLSLVPGSLPDWQGVATLDNGFFHITLIPASDRVRIPDLRDVYFYPGLQGQIEHTAPQEVARDGKQLVISIPVSRYLRNTPETLSGVLSAGESWVRDKEVPAIELLLPVSEKNGSGDSE
jgi:hypothetical protein